MYKFSTCCSNYLPKKALYYLVLAHFLAFSFLFWNVCFLFLCVIYAYGLVTESVLFENVPEM